MNNSGISPDDPRLTAYALGQLEGEERAAIETALHSDPALRATVDEIRAFSAQLESALANEKEDANKPVNTGQPWANAAILPARDPRVLDGGGESEYGRKRSKLLRFPQLYYVIGGAAAACVAVLVALREEPPPAEIRYYREIRLTPYPEMASAAQEKDAGEVAAGETPAAVTPVQSAVPGPERRFVARGDRGFVATTRMPVSSFPFATSTQSYLDVRRAVLDNRIPTPQSVRIEEMLNALPFRMDASTAEKSPGNVVNAVLEVAEAPWAPDHRLVRVGLAVQDFAGVERKPANLVFVVDVSSSMAEQEKLPVAKASLRRAIEKLRPDDRVAIVTFGGESNVVLPSTRARERQRIGRVVDDLTAAGTEHDGRALQLAFEQAKSGFMSGGVNRVILCTDASSSAEVVGASALKTAISDSSHVGIGVSVLGFGMAEGAGRTLEQVAASSAAGRHGRATDLRAAETFLIGDLRGDTALVASGVSVQVRFNPELVSEYRLIGYEGSAPGTLEFNADQASAMAAYAGQTVNALYEIIPKSRERAAAASRSDGADQLLTVRVEHRERGASVPTSSEFQLDDQGHKFERASSDFRFAAAIAGYGMVLQNSPHKGGASLDQVIAWAVSAAATPGDDPAGFRSGFIDLVRRTQKLM